MLRMMKNCCCCCDSNDRRHHRMQAEVSPLYRESSTIKVDQSKDASMSSASAKICSIDLGVFLPYCSFTTLLQLRGCSKAFLPICNNAAAEKATKLVLQLLQGACSIPSHRLPSPALLRDSESMLDALRIEWRFLCVQNQALDLLVSEEGLTILSPHIPGILFQRQRQSQAVCELLDSCIDILYHLPSIQLASAPFAKPQHASKPIPCYFYSMRERNQSFLLSMAEHLQGQQLLTAQEFTKVQVAAFELNLIGEQISILMRSQIQQLKTMDGNIGHRLAFGRGLDSTWKKQASDLKRQIHSFCNMLDG